MGAEDLLGVYGVERVGDPFEDLLEGPPGERRGVEEGLQHLGALGGVEPGCLVAGALGHRAAHRPGGEGLRPPFGHHRVLAAVHGIPDELGKSGHEVEGVEHRDGPVPRPAAVDGEQQVLRLGERHQRRAGVGEQGGREQVERLARPLRPVDAGGAVVGNPQLDASRRAAPAESPADLRGVEAPHGCRLSPYRSGRIRCRRRRRLARPRTGTTSCRRAIPHWVPGPPERHHTPIASTPSSATRNFERRRRRHTRRPTAGSAARAPGVESDARLAAQQVNGSWRAVRPVARERRPR